MKSFVYCLLFILLGISPLKNVMCQLPTSTCAELGGTTPVDIYNSPYTILPDGSLCCDLYTGPQTCISEEEVRVHCQDRGLVLEPCHFCKTCAKIVGERCGGTQGQYGRCEEGLECDETINNGTCLYGRGMHHCT